MICPSCAAQVTYPWNASQVTPGLVAEASRMTGQRRQRHAQLERSEDGKVRPKHVTRKQRKDRIPTEHREFAFQVGVHLAC
jgi:hypothetical protein